MRCGYSSSVSDAPSLRLSFGITIVPIAIFGGHISLLLSGGAPSSPRVRVVLRSFHVEGIRDLSVKLNVRVVVDRK